MVTGDREDFCFVAWRGTQSPADVGIGDWLQNINLSPHNLNDCPVPEGFWQSYAGGDNGSGEYFVPILNNFINSCMSKPNKQLVFTGHSQGGAAASVAHVANAYRNPLTITFGAPPFLSQLVDTTSTDCNNAFEKEHLWRFINSENYNGVAFDIDVSRRDDLSTNCCALLLQTIV